MPFGHPIKGDPCGGGGTGGGDIHIGPTPPVDTSLLWANTSEVVGGGWQPIPIYYYNAITDTWYVLTSEGNRVVTADGMPVVVNH